MLFNSIDFGIFFIVVFIIYWFLIGNKNYNAQNLFLLAGSYFFYSLWDWRFLSLIFINSIINYIIGIGLSRDENKINRKFILCVGVILNLCLLCFFKYFNFFIENFFTIFSLFGLKLSKPSLNIILPVGISFYTFQSLTYIFDIYRRKLKSTKNFIAFCAFISFFPLLLAGPIERALNLLPQFYKKRTFEYSKGVDYLRQILSGLFKKIVIADNCAKYADLIFNNSSSYSGSTLLLGAFFFAFQIYGDFSGYSDIAIGTAGLLGFDLKNNFTFPYFSRDIAEFWRRWHISLSSWFRDYLYIPLGGNRGNTFNKIRNVFLVFIISGFWHGANWTFIVWGALHATYYLPLLLLKKNKKHTEIIAKDRCFPNIKELFNMSVTFLMVLVAWIFFRAENLQHAMLYIKRILSMSLFTLPSFRGNQGYIITIILVFFFMIIEWLNREQRHSFANIGKISSKPMRWFLYILLLLFIYFFGNFKESIEFIYFQF